MWRIFESPVLNQTGPTKNLPYASFGLVHSRENVLEAKIDIELESVYEVM